MVTLTLGELRRLALPDDTEIYADLGDYELFGLEFRDYLTREPGGALPPVLEHPYAILLEMRAVDETSRDLMHRVDAALEA